jgi:Flp pilus assembly protein TadG
MAKLPVFCASNRVGRICRRLASARRGAIGVLAAMMLIVILAFAAFAIDVGMICMAKTQLQRAADASALAAANELLHQLSRQPAETESVVQSLRSPVQSAAIAAARSNVVFAEAPEISTNPTNDQAAEIVMGEMVRTGDGTAALSLSDPTHFNSVSVRVNRTADHNGELALFFGRVLGQNSVAMSAQAQAAFLQNFKGFRVPSGGGDPPPTLMFLPFAVNRGVWQNAQNGVGQDNYGWDKDSQSVQAHGDGVPEVSLFPLDTGAGGNFGTVDIGSNNSNTPTLRRQIVNGMTREDLAFHGGALELDGSGKLILSGDPGIKAGAIEPALQQIVGQARIIPLYNSVTGSGNQAQFTVVGFAGCRVLDVQLTGSSKYLRVQPTPIQTRGGIPGDSGTSSQIYSPVVLVK